MENIRSRDAFRDSLWDWSFLNDCFSGSIRASDGDGIVERNRHLLFLEGKPEHFVFTESHVGQIITLSGVSESPANTGLVLYGPPGTPRYMEVWPGKKIPCGVEEVQEFSNRWFKWASKYPIDWSNLSRLKESEFPARDVLEEILGARTRNGLKLV